MQTDVKRCQWVSQDPEYQRYHDEEWGRPVTDSQELFAKLCLDGQQAGLSWITILKKQPAYMAAFYDFEPHRVAQMGEEDVDRLMQNTGIVRNRLKLRSVITNARAMIEIEQQQRFADFIWQFTEGKTRVNAWTSAEQVPTATKESQAMSRALKKAGFKFVGETICYAFMQAVGMVNDHETDCWCYEACCESARR